MSKIIMYKGLPASGKSTDAKRMLEIDSSLVRVNKDDLRAMLHGGRWTKGNERQVLMIRNAIVIDSLNRGRSVLVDDTNLHPSHEQQLREIAIKHGAEFCVKDFTTVDLETCIKRDAKRANPVGVNVILKMYNQFLRPTVVAPVVNADLASCIIVDLDGTLAIMGDRSPYDATGACVNDALCEPVASVVKAFALHDAVILVSGRDEVVRGATEEWLANHEVPYTALYMRPQGDTRADTIVKREIYDSHIKDKYNVRFVIDDRPSVVRMWRGLGIYVLDVNQPGEEF